MRRVLTISLVSLGLFLGACGGDDDSEGCTSNADCQAGYTCNTTTGECVFAEQCNAADPDSCDPGYYCNDLGECMSCGDSVASCMIMSGTGQLPTGSNDAEWTMIVGSSAEITAVALNADGFPVYCADFQWAAETNSMSNSTYTASGAGSDTITATVDGSSPAVTCEAQVTVLPASGTDVKVYVYNDMTGQPIQDAYLVLDDGSGTPVMTQADGTGTLAVTGDFMLSVFKDEYYYVTLVGLNATDNTNIAVPLTYKPNYGSLVGGFTGELDFDYYENRYTNGMTQSLYAGFAGASIPLSSLMNLDFDAILGTMPSDCSSANQAGCYNIELGTALQEVSPLPGGLVVGTKTAPIKGWYDAIGQAGRRIGWALGGEADLLALTPLINMFLDASGGGDIANSSFNPVAIFSSAVPLLVRFASGISADIDLAGVTMDAWDDWREDDPSDRSANANHPASNIELREALQSFTKFNLNSFPADPDTAYDMDGVIVLTGVHAKGYGLVPTGAAASLDLRGPNDDTNGDGETDGEVWTPDGKPDSVVMCSSDTCPDGVSGVVDDGEVGMFYAPAHSGLQEAEPVTIMVALPLGDLASGTVDFYYGAVRMTGKVWKKVPTSSDTLNASDFLGFGADNADENNLPSHEMTVGSISGADIHMITISRDFSNDEHVRWSVFMPNSAAGDITLPPVPTGLQDPTEDSGNGILTTGFFHGAFALTGSEDFDTMVNNNGNNIERIPEYVDTFSVWYDYNQYGN